MPRGTLNIRLSESERRMVDMKAKSLGMPTGRYIRMKILTADTDAQKLIAKLENDIARMRGEQ